MNVFVGLIAHKRYCWRTKQGVVTIWKEHTQGHSAGTHRAHTGTLSRGAGKVTIIPPQGSTWEAKDLTIAFRSPSQTTGGGEEFKEEKLRHSSKILQLRLSCSHINFSFLSSLQFLSLPFLHWSWSPPCRQVCCLSGKSQMRRNWK